MRVLNNKPVIDFLLSKLFSRKLSVFVLSTIALFNNYITGSEWIIISSIYLGIEGTADVIERLFKARGGY